jgi:hypothetical protein
MIENFLCNIMLLYSSTIVLCVERIVVIASISECIFVYLQNIVIKLFKFLFFFSRMRLKNCKYLGFVTSHMEMDFKMLKKKFQHETYLMWQLLYNMSVFQILCLQIGGSWARCPTSNMSFVSNRNMFSRCIDCFSHCSTTHNLLLVIIDILLMIMTCLFLRCSMTLLGSWTMDKYPCVKIQNAMCVVVVIELKQNVITLVVTDNNIFLPSNWKCCVVYNFIKNFFPLPSLLMIICKPFGFLVMEGKVFFIHYLIAWWKCVCQIWVVKVWKQVSFQRYNFLKIQGLVSNWSNAPNALILNFKFNGWLTCIVKSEPYKSLISIKGESEIDMEKWLVNIS